MPQVAVLTPDPAKLDSHELWPKVLARLQRALSVEGIESVALPWTDYIEDASGLKGYAQVLPLLVWGYHQHTQRWFKACETWAREGVAISNPAKVLAWNTDKQYLLELAEHGVAIPATLCKEALDADDILDMFDQTGADELIIKPAVSAGAWHTRRVRRGESLEAPPMRMLVQPYLPTIEVEGETSLLYFGGKLSHVVNKRPVNGDFRVQEEYGGLYTVLEAPPAAAVALAEQVLAAIGVPLLYARIDMLPDTDGRWLLMEVELIEPDFYLGADPAQGAGFARALREVLDRNDA